MSNPAGNGHTLLIVDDDPLILPLLEERMGDFFDRVFSAASGPLAEEILDAHEVTHLLCDNNLGEGMAKGLDLIPRWRERFATIIRAVLFTGDAIPTNVDEEHIECVLKKPARMEEIRECLGVG